jgi:hypothetical protein
MYRVDNAKQILVSECNILISDGSNWLYVKYQKIGTPESKLHYFIMQLISPNLLIA